MPAASSVADTALALAREGAGHHQRGDLATAERLYRQALAADPGQRNALNNLALIELARGRRAAAIELLQRLTGAHPDFALGLNSLGSALMDDGRVEAALPLFERAAELQPELAEASNNLGIARSRLGREGALEAFDRAIAARSSYADAHANRGNLLREQGRLDDAEQALRTALGLAPDLAAAHSALGCVLKDQGRLEDAIESCRRAVELRPNVAEFHKNLGLVHRKIGDLARAAASARRALECQPDYADGHFDLAFASLLAGDFVAGWPEYEWRWKVKHLTVWRSFTCPEWRGEPIAGKSVLVWPEQGPGDVVMFAGCLPDLIEAGARVTLIGPHRLHELLRRSFPAAAVLPDRRQGEQAPWPTDADYAVPIGSLPLHFRRDEAAFRRPARYLRPDAARTRIWREAFARLGPGLRVGISWRAGKTAADARFRLSTPADWRSLFRIPGLTFVNLQYLPDPGELHQLQEVLGARIHPGPDAAGDLDDFAAACEALDAVVSIAGTPVHFSGALDKPTWTIAPFAPDWRWQLGREDCPWYPTMRLIRQGRNEPWADVVARAAGAFAAWARDQQGT